MCRDSISITIWNISLLDVALEHYFKQRFNLCLTMEANVEKDCANLGGVFQQIINDMKVSVLLILLYLCIFGLESKSQKEWRFRSLVKIEMNHQSEFRCRRINETEYLHEWYLRDRVLSLLSFIFLKIYSSLCYRIVKENSERIRRQFFLQIQRKNYLVWNIQVDRKSSLKILNSSIRKNAIWKT